MAGTATLGDHLRSWRRRRRLSQLDCALEVEMSQRHLSFIESGRTRPSREAVLRLAEGLDVPLRERNALLLAAGYAPVFPERRLDDPALEPTRRALEQVVSAMAPWPALVVDGQWRLVFANPPLLALVGEVAEVRLLEPPVNVLRLTLSPGGLAGRIRNLAEWRAHLLARLASQARATGDPALAALLAELSALPGPDGAAPAKAVPESAGPALPLEIEHGGRVLRLISTTTVFGAPREVTLAELAIEGFLPADEETARALTGG